MRLPCITAEQTNHEDARQLHERLYQNFLAGNTERVNVGTPDRAVTLSGNLHRFWRARGFHFRISGTWVYIEPVQQEREAVTA